MKSYVVLFVTVLMLMKPLWPIAEYVMNYDYIVNVLCKNKDRPELQCDGKCYLAQMLVEESKKARENPFSEAQTLEIPIILYVVALPNFNGLDTLVHYRKSLNGFSQDLHSLLLVFKVIHPPEAS